MEQTAIAAAARNTAAATQHAPSRSGLFADTSHALQLPSPRMVAAARVASMTCMPHRKVALETQGLFGRDTRITHWAISSWRVNQLIAWFWHATPDLAPSKEQLCIDSCFFLTWQTPQKKPFLPGAVSCNTDKSCVGASLQRGFHEGRPEAKFDKWGPFVKIEVVIIETHTSLRGSASVPRQKLLSTNAAAP